MNRWVTVVGLIVVMSACGKKGPPLPPLHRVAQAPDNFAATRRGGHVDLRFVVPAANSDGTRPANIRRVEIYALTSPAVVPAEQLLTLGTSVASVDVKGPKNADDVIEPGDAKDDLEPLEGAGLDQGVEVKLAEDLSKVMAAGGRDALLRLYVGVGVSRNGRRGLLSNAVAVPLRAAPLAPTGVKAGYDETSTTLTWPAVEQQGAVYNVYEVAREASRELARLTESPLSEPRFVDARLEWGVERCYVVRAAEVVDGLTAESDASPATCVIPKDTFPPQAPKGFETSPSQGSVSLVWDANAEKDLAGYIVLRADSEAAPLVPITPSPIEATAFADTVPSGSRRFYAVSAVDKAGNRSEPTARRAEVAR